MATAYIALGSNVGDREYYLKEAISLLNEMESIEVTGVSSIYETAPVGYTDQGQFLNMAARLETELSPGKLLDKMLEVEAALGRERNIRWGPRTLDLDILLYNQENIESERLTIPHPRMQDRGFVLLPLFELNPYVIIPTIDKSLSELINDLEDKEGVRVWKQKNGGEESGLFVN